MTAKKKKPHTKQRSYIREKDTEKDYSKGNASPYRDWVAEQPDNGDGHSDHRQKEFPEGNPDVLPEDKGLYYQAPCEDSRLEVIKRVMATLTDRQKDILRLCGNEGRTEANCAAILGINRSTVHETLNRIREKVRVAQEQG